MDKFVRYPDRARVFLGVVRCFRSSVLRLPSSRSGNNQPHEPYRFIVLSDYVILHLDRCHRAAQRIIPRVRSRRDEWITLIESAGAPRSQPSAAVVSSAALWLLNSPSSLGERHMCGVQRFRKGAPSFSVVLSSPPEVAGSRRAIPAPLVEPTSDLRSQCDAMLSIASHR